MISPLAGAIAYYYREPNLLAIWLAYGMVAVAGFFLCLWRPWTFVIFLPVSAFLAMAGLAETWGRGGLFGLENAVPRPPYGGMTTVWSPWVGPKVWHASASLVWQWHIAILLALAGPLAGLLLGSRRRRPARVP